MARLRVAVVSAFPPDPQGESHYSKEVFTRLAALHPEEVEIAVFAHFREGDEPSSSPLENLHVERVTGLQAPGGPSFAASTLRHLLTLLPFDVVHFQGPHMADYGGRMGEPLLKVLASLRRAGVPTVVTMHATWLKADLDDLWSRKRPPSPLRPLATRYAVGVVRRMCSTASRCRVLVSGDQSPVLAEWTRFHRLDPSRVVAEPHPCHPNPVDEEAQDASKRTLGVEGRLVVAALGFVRPDKGLHHLLEAAPSFLADPKRLLVLGGQPMGQDGLAYAAALSEQAERLGLKGRVRLEFRYFPDDELGHWLRAADLVALPYERAVGASGPIHQGLSHGKPVLASRVGQNRGLDGVVQLFDLGDPQSLAEAVEGVLGSPSRLADARKRAIAYAKAHTWDAMAREYLQDYLSLARRPLIDSTTGVQVGSRPQ